MTRPVRHTSHAHQVMAGRDLEPVRVPGCGEATETEAAVGRIN
jgi:hypothetical protein